MSVDEFIAEWVDANIPVRPTSPALSAGIDIDHLVAHLIASAVECEISGPDLMRGVGGDLRGFVESQLNRA